MALDPSIPLQVNSAIPRPLAEQRMDMLKEQAAQQQLAVQPQMDQQKLQAGQQELDSGKISLLLNKQKAVAQILGNVNDQASWENAIGWAQQNGLGDVAQQLPKQFDPAIRDKLLLNTIDAGKKLELQMQQAELSEKNRHNLATEKTAATRARGGLPFMDPETGDIVEGGGSAPTFGFPNPAQNMTPKVYNSMANEDSKRRQAYVNNRPIAENVLRILDQMKPNFDKFKTGGGGDVKLGAEKLANMVVPFSPFQQGSTAGANIEKGSNDLASELSKFQYMPGMRGSVLGLQTILASKPGVTQPHQTNLNIASGIRAKATDYMLSEELAQKYRQASPVKITDSNTGELDNALKTIYPIEEIDPKTGNVTFNKENAQRIRDVMDDAIANPKKYMEMAKQGAASSSLNPAKKLDPSIAGGAGRVKVQTPDGKTGTIDAAHVDDLIKAGGKVLQ